jgi:DNA-binding protein YbaB
LNNNATFERNLIPKHNTSKTIRREMWLYHQLFLSLLLWTLVFSFKLHNIQIWIRSDTRKSMFGNPFSKDAGVNKPKPGMFGGMGDMVKAMKQVQDMQKQAEILKSDLERTVVVGRDPAGEVECTYNGVGKPISLKVSNFIVSQGPEAVSLAATNAMMDAHTQSGSAMMGKMQDLYAGMGIPLPTGDEDQ